MYRQCIHRHVFVLHFIHRFYKMAKMSSATKQNDGSVQNAVYTALKSSIINLQLKPGTAISTQEIATKLQVSRTPVREAFIRLQRDALVEMHPQKDTVISKIDLYRVKQERFVREGLESAIIEYTIQNFTEADHQALMLIIEKQKNNIATTANQSEHMSLDNDFHKLLFTIGKQPLSWETIENLSTHYARVRLLTIWTPDIAQATIAQHHSIIEAIAQKDVYTARILLKAHLHNLETQIGDMIKQYPDYFAPDSIPASERFGFLLSQ